MVECNSENLGLNLGHGEVSIKSNQLLTLILDPKQKATLIVRCRVDMNPLVVLNAQLLLKKKTTNLTSNAANSQS